MKKRLLSVLLALCMLLTMLPTTVFAADSSTVETKVSVCGTYLPSTGEVSYWLYQNTNGKSSITKTGASAGYYNVKWEPETSTLTISGINAPYVYYSDYGEVNSLIRLDQGDLNIKLEGTTTIGNHSSNNRYYTIYAASSESTVTISGPGKLVARGGGLDNFGSGTPIRVYGNLILTDDATVEAEQTLASTDGRSTLIVSGDLTIKDRAVLKATRSDGFHNKEAKEDFALRLGGKLTLANEGSIELITFEPYAGSLATEGGWWHVAWTCSQGDPENGPADYITKPDGLASSENKTATWTSGTFGTYTTSIYFKATAKAEVHVYDRQVAEARYLAKEATLTTPATYYYSCSKCGASEGNADRTFPYGKVVSPIQYKADSYKPIRLECDQGYDLSPNTTTLIPTTDGSKGNIYYDSATYTLYLNNFKADWFYDMLKLGGNNKIGDFPYTITVNVTGDCSIEVNGYNAIYSTTSLVFEGTGTLALASKGGETVYLSSHKDMTVNIPMTVSSDSTWYQGISGYGMNLTVNAPLKVTNASNASNPAVKIDTLTIGNPELYFKAGVDEASAVKHMASDFDESSDPSFEATVNSLANDANSHYIDINWICHHTGEHKYELSEDKLSHIEICPDCNEVLSTELHKDGYIPIANTNRHQQGCTVCGYDYGGETEAHSSTTPATCTQKAVCDKCGAEYGDYATHTLINLEDAKYLRSEATDCQSHNTYWKSCSVCGASAADASVDYLYFTGKTVGPHSFSTDYLAKNADESKHYHVCTLCDAKDDGEAHTWNIPAATEETAKFCTVCQYIGEAKQPHVHNYNLEVVADKYLISAADCTTAATYHKSCRCTEFEENGDTFTVGDPLGHNYVKQEQTAANLRSEAADCREYDTYWLLCDRCNASAKDDANATDKYYNGEQGEHVADTANYFSSESEHWNVCLYHSDVKMNVTAHTYDQKVMEGKYLASAATCTEDATYYYSCVCGKTGTETFAKENSALGHEFNAAVKSEAAKKYTAKNCQEKDQYWYSCDREGCNAISDKFYFDGDVGPHIFDQQVTEEKYLVSAATCTDDAVYNYSCACGEKGTETFAKANSALGHDFTKEVKSEATKKSTAKDCTEHDVYYYSCSRTGCTAVSNTKTFEGEIGAHVADANYTIVGDKHYKYCVHHHDVIMLEETHTFNQQTKTYLKDAATCTDDATYYYTCVCGEKGTETYTEQGSALGHSYTKKIETAAYLKEAANCTGHNIYWYACSRCDASAKGEDENAFFTGTQTTSVGAHVPETTLSHDGSTHWNACQYHPDVKLNETAHTFDQHNTDKVYLVRSAACTEKAVYKLSCVCGEASAETFEDGEALGHSYTKMIETADYVNVPAADCQGHATYWFACARCGASAEHAENEADRASYTGETEASFGAHEYTDIPAEELGQYAEEIGHYHKVCSVCGGKSGLEEHSWNVPAATEQTDKHCTVCGYIAAEQQGHTFGEAWVSDADGHWHVCTGCGAPSEKEPHQYLTDEDNECSICGRSKVTIEVRLPEETTEEVNNPGTGAATAVAALLVRASRFAAYFCR